MNKKSFDTQEIIKILLVDDHELFRTGIVSLLNAQPDMEVIGQASDGLEATYKAEALKPDLIIMDINMPGMDGLEALESILSKNSDLSIVMLTVHDETDQVVKAIRLGAKGYILKNTNSDEFIVMVREVINNDGALSPRLTSLLMSEMTKTPEFKLPAPEDEKLTSLTNREKEVLLLIKEKLTDKEIALKLSISQYTVKSHVRNILSKLEVINRRKAAEYAINFDFDMQ